MLLLKGLLANPPDGGHIDSDQSTGRWPRNSLVNSGSSEYSANEFSWVATSGWHKKIYADTPERRIV
jgi:hypothetical protein